MISLDSWGHKYNKTFHISSSDYVVIHLYYVQAAIKYDIKGIQLFCRDHIVVMDRHGIKQTLYQ